MKFPFFIFIYQVNALQKCKPDNASFHPLRSTTNNRLVFFRPPPQADTCPMVRCAFTASPSAEKYSILNHPSDRGCKSLART